MQIPRNVSKSFTVLTHTGQGLNWRLQPPPPLRHDSGALPHNAQLKCLVPLAEAHSHGILWVVFPHSTDMHKQHLSTRK